MSVCKREDSITEWPINAIPLISIYLFEASEAEIVETLRLLVSENEPRDKAEVLRYLESRLLAWNVWTIVDDLLSPQGEWIGAPDIFTDGVWGWSYEVIYYVRKYNFLLPSAFLEHMRTCNWRMPDIDLRKVLTQDTETVWPCN
jgi:hypothetical protein